MARSEGFAGHMEPGISAEDCLYADLGIDPVRFGCQHFEASQLLLYQRRIDPTAYLVLWQVGLVGHQSMARLTTGPAYQEVLAKVLAKDYPLNHEIIIYCSATLLIQGPRMDRIALADLPKVEIGMVEIVVIPPAVPLRPNLAMRRRLAVLDQQISDGDQVLGSGVFKTGASRPPQRSLGRVIWFTQVNSG